MDSDPLTEPDRAKLVEKSKSPSFLVLALLVCLFCVVSSIASGLTSLDVYRFQTKIKGLEERIVFLEEKYGETVDIASNGIKRDTVNIFRNRVARDLAATGNPTLQKDGAECICPAGKKHAFYPNLPQLN